MSEWKKVKFSSLYLISSKNGLTKPSRVRGNGYKMINMGELFSNGRLYDISMELVPLTNVEKEKNQVLSGDLLFARQSLVLEGAGKCCIVMEVSDMTVFESHLIRVRLDGSIAYPLFYYYYFNSPYNPIKTIVTQCAQAGIRANDLSNIDVISPPINIQHRIATILSRYDTLIENYQKQIKLLEEAAQRLYKEWFVELRFPGHEKTKMVDGLPEGWERKAVDSIYSIKYGKNLSTKLISESGDFPVYGANGVIGYYDKANCNEQVVLITSRGNGSGDVLMTYHKEAFITNNSFIVSPLEDYSYCQLPFTYQFLRNANFRAVRTGAAQPQLTNQSIHTVDVVLPTKGMITAYCEKVSHSNEMIIRLKDQIRLLTEARDRLLPRLMGGEMEV